MARNTFEPWIPEEADSEVITRVTNQSAVEARGERVPMNSATKYIPRSAGVTVGTVAKGVAYDEDVSLNDQVLLTARKIGEAIRIAEEDIDDSIAAVIATKQKDWATSYAKFLDNAALGCSGTENGTTIPFTSVYKTLATAATALDGYTANLNIVTAAASAGVTYANLSTTLGLYENSDYFDATNSLVIASPTFRASLRGVLDTQGRPIFVGGLAGTPDTLFSIPVFWSLGCRLHATATASPTGSPLLIVGNPDYLKLGVRSGPETLTATGDTGVGFLTDEAILKMRARRGFGVGHPKAFACLVGV